MLISTNTGGLKKYGRDSRSALNLIKTAGFDAYDFSMFGDSEDEMQYAPDYAFRARELKDFADDMGIVCNQAHAPFPTFFPGNATETERRAESIIRSLEIAAILGAKACVVHPYNNFGAEQNAEHYARFVPYARQFGVKIAVENMWNWPSGSPHATPAACSSPSDFLRHLSLLDPEIFVACVDIGHAEMEGMGTSAPELIHALGSRVGAIHLHDNNKREDLHTLPFAASIDYSPVISALAEVGYGGDITLETVFAGKFPEELVLPALTLMAKVADYFRKSVMREMKRSDV